MATTDTNSQSPIFLDRLQRIFSRREEQSGAPEPRRGLVIATCLLLSFLLWFIFTMQETYTSDFDIPIRVTNVPADEALADLPPERARVRVQGEGFQLLRLAMNPPSIPLDAATGEVDLQAAVDLPTGVALQGVSPQRVQIRTEPRETRRIPIVFRGEVRTPPTHALVESPSIEPESVVVTGPQSIIFNLNTWPTEPLVLEDARDTVRVNVALADTLRGLVTRSVETVQVHAVAERFTEGVREIEVRVAGGPGQAVTLEPATVRVRYRVPVDQYRLSQQAEDFFAEVNYEEIRDDTTGFIRPTLNLPVDLDIRDVEVTPSRLRYYIFIPGE